MHFAVLHLRQMQKQATTVPFTPPRRGTMTVHKRQIDDGVARPTKRYKAQQLTFRSLPPQIILYILEFHDFSLQDCTVHFSCNHSQDIVTKINMLLRQSTPTHTINDSFVTYQHKEKAKDTIHKLLNKKLPTESQPAQSYVHIPESKNSVASSVLSGTPTDVTTVLDFANPNQVLLSALRMHQDKIAHPPVIIPSPKAALIRHPIQLNIPCSCGCHRLRRNAPEDLRDIFLQHDRLDENTISVTSQTLEIEDEDMDLETIHRLALNQRRLIPNLHQNSRCSASLFEEELFHPRVNRTATIKFLIRSLFGYFARDRSRTPLLIFSSLNIDATQFPQKALALFMDHKDRHDVMSYVEKSQDDSMPKIDLAIGLVFRAHVNLMIDLVSTMSIPLAHVNLSCLQLHDGHISVLHDRNVRIKSLDLSNNRITDKGVRKLSKLYTLENLSLTANDVSDKGMRELLKNPKLRTLQMGNNSVTDNGLKNIVWSANLRALDLSFNMIHDEGLRHIASCKTLKKLSLRYMCLRDEAVQEYFTNTEAKLKHLDLSYNSIGDNGAKIIASHGSHLVFVNLEYNNISSEGAAALLSPEASCQLKKLLLNNNQIYSNGVQEIGQNTTLQYLNLSRNQLCDRAATEFVNNTDLLYLDVSHNNMTIAGVQLLEEYGNMPHLEIQNNLQ
jgi:Leucine-rich repeat (LRR) protein